jgi:hypothetical protein
MARKRKDDNAGKREALLDEAIEESFPASDPISPAVGPGEPIAGAPTPHSRKTRKRNPPASRKP